MPGWAQPARQRLLAFPSLLSDDRGTTAVSHELKAQRRALTAAAMAVEAGRTRVTPTYANWQTEAWGFYETLGEFRYVVDWKSNMISRIRLRAAKKGPGNDEPTIVDTGPAAEIVNDLSTIMGDQVQLMASIATHINVPGECWLIGETIDDKQVWRVCSSEEIRSRGPSFEIISETSSPQNVEWRPLADNSMVVRVWRPHKRLYYLADSPARAAATTMRELDLVSRHMMSQYLSRLASAGVFLIPEEIVLPSRPEFEDAPDPFVREWIETAAEAIRTPGTAAGIVPIPMRVPLEYIDGIRHIDFTLKHDDKITEKRTSVIQRLAVQLDAPPEIMLGTSGTNHWGAWAITEDAIKAHILPSVEVIVWALTIGYLHPRLKALGEDTTDLVVWYDASEVTIRPDRSENAKDAYDRFEINGRAFRREVGFDETDSPTVDELHQLVLKRLAALPATGMTALDEILGRQTIQIPTGTSPVSGVSNPNQPQTSPAQGPPTTEGDVAPSTQAAVTAAAVVNGNGNNGGSNLMIQLIKQACLLHVIEFTLGDWQLYHPRECIEHLFSCPFTSASYTDGMRIHPGASGRYACRLNNDGSISLGDRVLNDIGDMIEATYKGNLA